LFKPRKAIRGAVKLAVQKKKPPPKKGGGKVRRLNVAHLWTSDANKTPGGNLSYISDLICWRSTSMGTVRPSRLKHQ